MQILVAVVLKLGPAIGETSAPPVSVLSPKPSPDEGISRTRSDRAGDGGQRDASASVDYAAYVNICSVREASNRPESP
jgi:hypothetical protein